MHSLEISFHFKFHCFRLFALVNLQTHPLKEIFPPSHPNFLVQFHILCTRQPLCLKLHTNYQLRAHASYSFFFPPLLPKSLPTLASSLSSRPPPTLPSLHPPLPSLHPHAGGGAPSPPPTAGLGRTTGTRSGATEEVRPVVRQSPGWHLSM
jgi:hypothetical protein